MLEPVALATLGGCRQAIQPYVMSVDVDNHTLAEISVLWYRRGEGLSSYK